MRRATTTTTTTTTTTRATTRDGCVRSDACVHARANAEGDEGWRAPRALKREGGARATGAGARTARASMTASAFGVGGDGGCSAMSEQFDASDAVSADFAPRGARLEGSRRLKVASAITAVVQRGGARRATSDTTLVDNYSDFGKDTIRARNEQYLMKLEARKAVRLRATEAWTQSLTPLMLHAHALTERAGARDAATQADEFCRGHSRTMTRTSVVHVRTMMVLAIESALRERQQAEYCLKYRALRPIEDARALSSLETLTSKSHAHGLSVTCIKFNPCREDMFVVSYGALDFDAAHTEKHAHGALAFYSTRSRAPLHVARFNRGVMTVDWCAACPTLLALGCYDGDIIVLDVRQFACATAESSMNTQTCAQPRVSDTRHAAPAWGVRWTRVECGATIDGDDATRAQAVVSTSTDGKVMRWDVRDALHGVEVLSVDWSPPGGAGHAARGRDASSSGGRDLAQRRGGVMCLDFSKDETCYIIGTQEGNIHKCSLGYVNEYLATYSAHVGPIYCVTWNPFHPRVFATCSADGKVKIFVDCTLDDHSFMAVDETTSRINSAPIKPTFVMEHSQRPINSLDWSPWCSTEFAVVTDDGALEIWNLASSVAIPQTVVQVTSDHTPGIVVSYARDAPVIIVGCACGSVSLFRINWPIRGDIHAKGEQQRRLESLFKSSRVA